MKAIIGCTRNLIGQPCWYIKEINPKEVQVILTHQDSIRLYVNSDLVGIACWKPGTVFIARGYCYTKHGVNIQLT